MAVGRAAGGLAVQALAALSRQGATALSGVQQATTLCYIPQTYHAPHVRQFIAMLEDLLTFDHHAWLQHVISCWTNRGRIQVTELL